MNNLHPLTRFVALFIISATVISWPARTWAETKSNSPWKSHTGTSDYSAPSDGKGAITGYALGVSASSGINFATTTITGMMVFDRTNMLQGFFGVPSTSPFQFAFSGVYKHTVHQMQEAGFHVGGGVGFGAIERVAGSGAKFALSASALVGIHFSIPGATAVKIHFDGGPVLQVIDSAAALSIGALSSSLGLSVLYEF